MFLSNSRYAKVTAVETTGADGNPVVAIKLRRLPPTSGQPLEVKDNTQLDHIALEKYANPTQFWHIADANTELDSRQLVVETGAKINVPES
jgi:hypothetical protein